MKKLILLSIILIVGCKKEPTEIEICGLMRYPEHPGGATEYYCYSDVSEAKCNSKAETYAYNVDFQGSSKTCAEYCEGKSSCHEI